MFGYRLVRTPSTPVLVTQCSAYLNGIAEMIGELEDEHSLELTGTLRSLDFTAMSTKYLVDYETHLKISNFRDAQGLYLKFVLGPVTQETFTLLGLYAVKEKEGHDRVRTTLPLRIRTLNQAFYAETGIHIF